MANQKPSTKLLDLFKSKVVGLHEKTSEGHWLPLSRTQGIQFNYKAFTIAAVLFIVHNEILPNEDQTVKMVCNKQTCEAPAHHRLVQKHCKSKQDWTNTEFDACEQYLLHRSKETRNPNPVKTIEGNCRLWQGPVEADGYARPQFLTWHAPAHVFSYAVKTKSVQWDGTVRHLCNNKTCIEPRHLSTGTRRDQEVDKIANGTSSHGENNANSKLTEEQVRTIKFQEDSRPLKEIADQYGVTFCSISSIRHGLNWAFVGPTEAENNKYVVTKYKKYERIPFEEWENDYKIECKKQLEENSIKVEANPTTLKSDCWLSTYHANSSGYAEVKRRFGVYFVHILSYMLKTNKTIPEGLQVRHLCIQHPSCCNPDHLTEGTGIDQAQDKRNHGTILYGAKNPMAKITEDVAQEILNSKGNGMSRLQMASKYKVTEAMVTQIRNGKSWGHLKRQSDNSSIENANTSNKRQHTSIAESQPSI